MKISRLLKTIFMIDFVTGLLIAIKETFKAKKTIRWKPKISLAEGIKRFVDWYKKYYKVYYSLPHSFLPTLSVDSLDNIHYGCFHSFI